MNRKGRHSLTTLTVASVALALSSAQARACELEPGQGMRRGGDVPLLGTATATMVPAARGVPVDLAAASAANDAAARARTPAVRPAWWRRVWSWLSDHSAPQTGAASPSRPFGQVVQIQRVGGPDSASLELALQRSGGEAVLVRWLLAGDCGPMRDSTRTAFLPPGATVFAIGRLRPVAGWVGDRPTFDLPAGGSAARPLVQHPSATERPRWLLPPADYFELYRRLPRQDSLPADTASALKPLRAWLASHPALREYQEATWELDAVKGYVLLAARERTWRRP